MLRSDELDDW